VDVPEVEAWQNRASSHEIYKVADAAILALARLVSQLVCDKSDCQEAAQKANEAAALANADNEQLRSDVAKYKWQRDLCSVDLCIALTEPALLDAEDQRCGSSSAVIADLDLRWAEHVKENR
jgi:hypothetical protein